MSNSFYAGQQNDEKPHDPYEGWELVTYPNGREAYVSKAEAATMRAQAEQVAQNQPLPPRQSVQEQAKAAALELYSRLIAEEESKNAAQRQFEDSDAQLEAYGAEYYELLKHATQNAPRLAELEGLMHQADQTFQSAQKTLSAEAEKVRVAEFEAQQQARSAQPFAPVGGGAVVPRGKSQGG